jgi:hypothetical protein
MKHTMKRRTISAVVLAVAVGAVTVSGASARTTHRTTVKAQLAHIQEPGSVSALDTFNFQEPTGVYGVGAQF